MQTVLSMQTGVTRGAAIPAVAAPTRTGHAGTWLSRALSTLANAVPERLVLSGRELAPEWFRHPLP